MSVKLENDQANELRTLFEEIAEDETQIQTTDEQLHEKQELDVLNLPPRKEVHIDNNKRTQLKIGNPLYRFIFVIFILVVIMTGAYYFWEEGLLNLFE